MDEDDRLHIFFILIMITFFLAWLIVLYARTYGFVDRGIEMCSTKIANYKEVI